MKPAILLLLSLTATAQDRWVLTLPLHWHKASELTPYVDGATWRYRHEDAYGPVRIGRTLPDDYWVARDCSRKVEGFISSPMFPTRDIASAQIQTECLVVGVDRSKARLMRTVEATRKKSFPVQRVLDQTRIPLQYWPGTADNDYTFTPKRVGSCTDRIKFGGIEISPCAVTSPAWERRR